MDHPQPLTCAVGHVVREQLSTNHPGQKRANNCELGQRVLVHRGHLSLSLSLSLGAGVQADGVLSEGMESSG